MAAGGAVGGLLADPRAIDPLIYRWYQIVSVCGTSIKELRLLMGDRRDKFRFSPNQSKPQSGSEE